MQNHDADSLTHAFNLEHDAALERAAAFCAQQGGAEGTGLAAALRAHLSSARPVQAGHDDFAMCEHLLAWNRSQSVPPIRVGSEHQVGLEAFRLSQMHQPAVLIATPGQPYRVLPQDLPEPMLQALALVTRWDPSDECGEDSDRTAVLEGWNALLAMAPEVTLPAPDEALAFEPRT